MNIAVLGLKHPFFPYARINQVPICLIRDTLIRIFKKWGKPKAIRMDNGEPFGSQDPSTTTELALWLVGYGIHVIWNKPGCPQQNGKVERNQSTSRRCPKQNLYIIQMKNAKRKTSRLAFFIINYPLSVIQRSFNQRRKTFRFFYKIVEMITRHFYQFDILLLTRTFDRLICDR